MNEVFLTFFFTQIAAKALQEIVFDIFSPLQPWRCVQLVWWQFSVIFFVIPGDLSPKVWKKHSFLMVITNGLCGFYINIVELSSNSEKWISKTDGSFEVYSRIDGKFPLIITSWYCVISFFYIFMLICIRTQVRQIFFIITQKTRIFLFTPGSHWNIISHVYINSYVKC